MDLRARLLSLLPIAVGDELAPGVRLTGASTELGLRLSFDAHGRAFQVELQPAATGGKHAARTAAFLLGYRAVDGAASTDGKALCEAVARAIAPREDAVLADAPALDARKLREVEVEHLLEDAGGFYTLSPYVGCLIGCRFCYAQSRLDGARRFAGLPLAPWGSWVDARVNAPAVLARELARLPRKPIKFCPIVSDPYHAIEERLRLTRACLEVVAAVDWPVLLVTRAALVARDADLLAGFTDAWVGMSVPTVDDTVRAHFEPRAASVAERLATLRRLRARGVHTIAIAQPMLPGPVDALADALAAVVESVSVDRLRGEEGAGALFDDARFAEARGDAWQTARLAGLRAALAARGVTVWDGELPPALR